MNFDYDEFDYSKTTLIQRTPRQATVDFDIDPNSGDIVVRLPANERAKEIVDNITSLIKDDEENSVDRHIISLSTISSKHRTAFFTRLISEIPGYDLLTVTNLKVARTEEPVDDETIEVDIDVEMEEAKERFLGFVKDVTMRGDNLVMSRQYQELSRSGFFITAITWRSREKRSPSDMVMFEVAFDEEIEGTGFKYLVRHSQLIADDRYQKTYKPYSDLRQRTLFSLIETTADKIISELHHREQLQPTGKA